MNCAVILYDDDCGFCRWTLAWVLRWDRRRALRPVRLQAPEADRLLGGMPEERKMASWHLVTEDGRVHSGGAAFEPLGRLLPGGAVMSGPAAAFPRAAERAYRWVAEHRTPFGRITKRLGLARADRLIRARAAS